MSATLITTHTKDLFAGLVPIDLVDEFDRSEGIGAFMTLLPGDTNPVLGPDAPVNYENWDPELGDPDKLTVGTILPDAPYATGVLHC